MAGENSHSPAVLKSEALPSWFGHSLHVRVLDGGDCGACLNEIHQLTGPVYSLHRFGITLTPTPREADVLIVVGPVTVAMQRALRESYESMPDPKRVLAIGACALSGGVYASSFAVTAPVAHSIPVDVEVPGCPPSPLAILEGLRLIMGPSGNGAAREGM
jgi:Ni,Fe-hydrogenase III small subunit